ncbi:hypothetical protein M514_11203, partial [Trichuris suis]
MDPPMIWALKLKQTDEDKFLPYRNIFNEMKRQKARQKLVRSVKPRYPNPLNRTMESHCEGMMCQAVAPSLPERNYFLFLVCQVRAAVIFLYLNSTTQTSYSNNMEEVDI